MSDPRLALWLYIAVIAVGVMFSPKWGAFFQAIKSAKDTKLASTE